jgi:hypothetical protein
MRIGIAAPGHLKTVPMGRYCAETSSFPEEAMPRHALTRGSLDPEFDAVPSLQEAQEGRTGPGSHPEGECGVAACGEGLHESVGVPEMCFLSRARGRPYGAGSFSPKKENTASCTSTSKQWGLRGE